MKRFQNPWAKGGENYPNEILSRDVLKTNIFGDRNKRKDESKSQKLAEEILYRDKRIKEEIAQLKKKYPNKSYGDLQIMVAVKYQIAEWYRVGETDKTGVSKNSSQATDFDYRQILVVVMYEKLSFASLLTDAGYNRETLPINSRVLIPLDPKNKYEAKSFSGKMKVFFDDKGVPDTFYLAYKSVNGELKTFFKDYGEIGNNDDNTFIAEIELQDMESPFLTLEVGHQEDSNFYNTDYDIQITAIDNAYAQLKEGKISYTFIDLSYYGE